MEVHFVYKIKDHSLPVTASSSVQVDNETTVIYIMNEPVAQLKYER